MQIHQNHETYNKGLSVTVVPYFDAVASYEDRERIKQGHIDPLVLLKLKQPQSIQNYFKQSAIHNKYIPNKTESSEILSEL